MRLLPGFIAGASINIVFWVIYSATGNLVSGIGITVVVTIFSLVGLRRVKINDWSYWDRIKGKKSDGLK